MISMCRRHKIFIEKKIFIKNGAVDTEYKKYFVPKGTENLLDLCFINILSLTGQEIIELQCERYIKLLIRINERINEVNPQLKNCY